ncbi:2302_t:CDS:2 [Diversispora eburnea]|uniref:2302_t:CDS:1 n=1 Tax=Diversispora eburnea TaxID=1213867 RepID=A0A9N9FWV5_9GLOM|nr:2302_t:CDS:2 [Diversispora eburnea]
MPYNRHFTCSVSPLITAIFHPITVATLLFSSGAASPAYALSSFTHGRLPSLTMTLRTTAHPLYLPN